MSAITDYLYNTLVAEFPDIDWEIGSVVRELVLEPMVLAAATMENRIETAAEQRLDIILANPLLYADQIKSLAAKLGIPQATSVPGTGTILFYVTGSSDLQIPYTTYFTAAGVQLITNSRYTLTLTKTTDTDLLLTRAGSLYVADVPVQTVSAHGAIVPSGVPVTASLSSSRLSRLLIGEQVDGGRTDSSIADYASAIKSKLTASTLNSRETAQEAIRFTNPALIAGVKLAGCSDPVVQALLPRLNGVAVGGAAAAYLSTVSGYSHWRMPVMVTADSNDMLVTLTGLQACGVFKPVSLELDGVTYSSFTWTVTGVPGTSNQTIVVRFSKPSEATFPTDAVLVVGGSPELNELQAAVSSGLAAPFPVYCIPPAYLQLSMLITLPSAAVNNEASIVGDLTKELNRLPLNTALIHDRMLEAVLSTYSAVMVTPVIYQYTGEVPGGVKTVGGSGIAVIDASRDLSLAGVAVYAWQLNASNITVRYV